ncbi:enoyl-CoA hydratase-related protein [Natrialba sp. PRR66]|uniref:enoyl-CoA hydratase/isomerase family protein n=1 Tax=Natrialba sp. PRR66 TaxID=3098146 RepID=UPI002B1D006A|nr:enoyl-CoA hydratase-related protein [Natrialba sp. PRR66]
MGDRQDTMDEYTNLDVRHDDGIAWVAIESDSSMNSLNDTLVTELMHVATGCDEDDDVRCLVLQGSNGVFSAGGNITSFDEDQEVAAADIRRGASALHDVITQLKRNETPLVTGINGPAVGAGFSLALLGDISVMHEDAYLQYGYPGVGLTGDGSSTFYLPRIVGLQEAKRIALLNEQISPTEADELGLVTEVPDANAFDDRLAEIADRIAQGPTKALGRIARLFDETYARQLPDQLATETEQMAATVKTDDYLEGVSAFKDKREPEFTGQ